MKVTGNTRFGQGLAGGQNVGGTGKADIAVGGYNYDLFDKEGIVAVYFDGGPESETPLGIADADVLLYGATESEQAGHDVEFLADMNGDGHAELLVGAPRYDGPGSWSGAAYLVHGSDLADGGTINLDDSTRIIGESGLDRAGDKVTSGGDIDGDGIADLIIAAPYNEAGGGKLDGYISSAGMRPCLPTHSFSKMQDTSSKARPPTTRLVRPLMATSMPMGMASPTC